MTWKEFKDYVDGEIERLGADEDVDIFCIDTMVFPDMTTLGCFLEGGALCIDSE